VVGCASLLTKSGETFGRFFPIRVQYTLVQKIKNKIISVEQEHIKVKSEKLEELERFLVHSLNTYGIRWLLRGFMFQETMSPIFIAKLYAQFYLYWTILK
jgi:hypothetical protein